MGLVGDVGGTYNIACDYYDWGQGGWYDYSGASDVKYTYIMGTDLLPEIVIGRISADNSSDLANIINKTKETLENCEEELLIAYEKISKARLEPELN